VPWAYLDISRPMIAWLTYRGEYFSVDANHPQAISVFLSERLRGATNGAEQLAIEMAIESRRQDAFPDACSRLHGVYAFQSRDDALRAASRWNLPAFVPDNLTELVILPGSRVSVHDSEWITQEFGGSPGPWIDQYLAGAPYGAHPLPELLIEGSAAILNTPLRERAGQVVHNTWPDACAPLEIGRIAFEIGFPFGRMTAAIRPDADGVLTVVYDLAFDGNDPKFVEAFGKAIHQPGYPVDWDSLKAIDEENWFRAPDMRKFMFRLG